MSEDIVKDIHNSKEYKTLLDTLLEGKTDAEKARITDKASEVVDSFLKVSLAEYKIMGKEFGLKEALGSLDQINKECDQYPEKDRMFFLYNTVVGYEAMQDIDMKLEEISKMNGMLENLVGKPKGYTEYRTGKEVTVGFVQEEMKAKDIDMQDIMLFRGLDIVARDLTVVSNEDVLRLVGTDPRAGIPVAPSVGAPEMRNN